MGWIFALETKKPFHNPQAVPAAKFAKTIKGNGVLEASWVKISFEINSLPKAGFINTAPMAADMAMTAPTERSTPPVAITIVIPIATRINGAPLLTTSIRFPYK